MRTRLRGGARKILLRALLLAAAALAPMSASAAGTQTMTVGATVLSQNRCQFTNAGPTALTFAAIDPSSATAATASASTTFVCRGADPVATYVVSSDDGLYESGANQPRMQHATAPSEFLRYSLNLPRTGNAPRNATQTLTVTATVQPAAFQNALVGSYSDTVILTIEP